MKPEPAEIGRTLPLQDLFLRVRTPLADRPRVSNPDAMFQLMAMLAAPRLLAGEFVSDVVIAWMREGLWQRIIDRYLGTLSRVRSGVEDEPDDLLRTQEPTRRAKRLFAEWVFSRTAPEALVRAARDFFREFGWSQSDQDWDEVRGPLQRGIDPATCAAPEPEPPQVMATGEVDESAFTGTLFACKGEGRVILFLGNTQRAYLPCFTTEAKLREFHEHMKHELDRIERIEDGRAFAEGLPIGTGELDLRLMLDAHLLPGARMEWKELPRDFELVKESVGIVHMVAFAR